MKELWVAGLLTIGIFGFAYYQSYRDKQRWKRISSGMSLFGVREDIPPLALDGRNYESSERRVMVIWGNQKHSPFDTVSDAIHRVERESGAKKAWAKGARIFAWDGEIWKQRR